MVNVNRIMFLFRSERRNKLYKINCGIKFNEGIQIEFDNIEDFHKFNNDRKNKDDEDHNIKGYVKSINCEVVYIDEYDSGYREWYVVGGKFLNYLEPLCWHPLEDYKV